MNMWNNTSLWVGGNVKMHRYEDCQGIRPGWVARITGETSPLHKPSAALKWRRRFIPSCFPHAICILRASTCGPGPVELLNWRLKCRLLQTTQQLLWSPKTHSLRKRVGSGVWASHPRAQGFPAEVPWLLFLITHRVMWVAQWIVTTLCFSPGWARNYSQVDKLCRLLLTTQGSKFAHCWATWKKHIPFPWAASRTLVLKVCLNRQPHRHLGS